MSTDLLDYDSAARFLGIKRTALQILVSKNQVPYYRPTPRVVRFRQSELESWFRMHANEISAELAGTEVS